MKGSKSIFQPMATSDWRALLDASEVQLSNEERNIAELLVLGQTQAAIAQQLGLHRSAVWRKTKAMSAKKRRAP